MVSQLPLLNALQKAQLDALKLLVSEQEHHALCWRSTYFMPHYGELLANNLRPAAHSFSTSEKRDLASKLEWVEINIRSAEKEKASQFSAVCRRSVIVLADIVENVVEATLALCLMHVDLEEATLKDVTSFKREAKTERDFKTAVRRWEAKLFRSKKQRTARLESMISAFFPEFVKPKNFEVLDRLFNARNQFTHEAIIVSSEADASAPKPWCLTEVEEAFRVAGDFLIALMSAIPGDLEAPITPNAAP